MQSADERIPGHSILQQIDIFTLHWKIFAIICPDVSVHFPVDSSCAIQEHTPREVLRLSFSKISSGLRSVIWLSIPSDMTAEGMACRRVVGMG